jgi:hypothetical protein
MEDFSDEASREMLSAKRRRCCHFRVALASTLSECPIRFLGTPGMSVGFHAKMFRLARRKLTSTSSYLG